MIFGLGAGIPALVVAGFMPEIDVLPAAGWAAIAAVSSSAGAWVMAERGRGVAAGLGFVGGPLAIGAIVAYTALRASLSSTYWTLEFVLPAGLVAAPLVGLHRWLHPPIAP